MQISKLMVLSSILIFGLLATSYVIFRKLEKSFQPRTDFDLMNSIVIDETDDPKALGFPGQKKLAVDSQGNIYLGYRKKLNNVYEIYVARISKNKDNKWEITGTQKPIANVKGEVHQRVPSLVADSQDTIHVVWYGSESSKEENNRQIKYASSKDRGSSWSEWTNIAYVAEYDDENLWQEHPDILAAKNGKLLVVWEGKDKDHQNQQIKLTASEDMGQNWTPWININATPDSKQSRPTIVEDTNGALHIFMYSTLNGSVQQVWHTSSRDGKNWNSWNNISRSTTDARHVSVTTFNEQIVVAWRTEMDSGDSTGIYYSIFDGSNWSYPQLVSESKNYQFFPNLGKDGNNAVYVSWMETPEKSEYPQEDPEEGIAYVQAYFLNKKTFSKKKKITKQSNVLYPYILSNNRKIPETFLTYLLKSKSYEIYLTHIKTIN